jgi:Sec-independent protein translocase protein TatA
MRHEHQSDEAGRRRKFKAVGSKLVTFAGIVGIGFGGLAAVYAQSPSSGKASSTKENLPPMINDAWEAGTKLGTAIKEYKGMKKAQQEQQEAEERLRKQQEWAKEKKKEILAKKEAEAKKKQELVIPVVKKPPSK